MGRDDEQPPSPRVDEVDRRILELLGADARCSARALGRAIGMSPGAISERVARLERTGVIRGYHAEVDARALGFHLQVVIGVQVRQGSSLTETLDGLLEVPEILSVHVVTGRWDLVIVAQARDQEHLRTVIETQIWALSSFQHGETMVVLDSRERSSSEAPAAPQGTERPSREG